MATATQAAITLTDTYVDLTVANPALASVDVMLQFLSDDAHGYHAEIICATTAVGGPIRLAPGDSMQVNAAKIWVRGPGQLTAVLL